MKTIRFPLVALLACAACFAVETRFWQQGDRGDFERGTLTHLSLRGDGRIFLSPELTEVFDSSTPYLWTLAAGVRAADRPRCSPSIATARAGPSRN
jgi:hypothetical protein